jgi:hypothetical protein
MKTSRQASLPVSFPRTATPEGLPGSPRLHVRVHTPPKGGNAKAHASSGLRGGV